MNEPDNAGCFTNEPRQLTDEEIDLLVSLIKQASRAAMIVPLHAVQALMEQHDREEALLPLLDPTLWMRTHDKTRWHKPWLRAFLEYRKALQDLADTERGG